MQDITLIFIIFMMLIVLFGTIVIIDSVKGMSLSISMRMFEHIKEQRLQSIQDTQRSTR